jgi:hypothetical protein
LQGAPSATLAKWTSSGVKDKYHVYFFEQLQELCRKLKNGDDEGGLEASDLNQSLESMLANLRKQMPQNDAIFNPALGIHGTNLHSNAI